MNNIEILDELREVKRNLSSFLVKSNRISITSIDIKLASQRIDSLIKQINEYENRRPVESGITTGDC